MTNGAHRGRNSMKLLGSLRGQGLVSWEGESAPVRYQLDVFEGRDRRTGSGVLDGELTRLDGREDTVRLRLEDGFELDVALLQVDVDGAMFETRSDLPSPS